MTESGPLRRRVRGGFEPPSLRRSLQTVDPACFLARGTPRGLKCRTSVSGILLRETLRTQNTARVDTLSRRPVRCSFCSRSGGGGSVPGSTENIPRCSGIGFRSGVPNGRPRAPVPSSGHSPRLEPSPLTGTAKGLSSRSSVVFRRPYSCTVPNGPHAAVYGSLDP